METIRIDGKQLTLDQVRDIARGRARAELDPAARTRMTQGREALEKILAAGTKVYGVNTGFGKLKNVAIPREKMDTLQTNLIRSHCAGVGDPFPEDVVRAVMVIRANTLAQGASAIRPQIVDNLLAMLDRNLIPEIPCQGSVSASGDLAPLSHLALTLMGEGQVRSGGMLVGAGAALKEAGIPISRFGPKEGLSLINGTQVTSGIGCLVASRAGDLAVHADIATGLSVEALKASVAPFEEAIHRMRPHLGQLDTAANLRSLLRDSPIMESHRDCDQVQDSYSLRCAPQVHGAVRDAIRHAREILVVEVNSVTDNPILDPDGERFLMGGNFHGAPVGHAMDFLGIALADLAAISERRLEKLLNPDLSGLPAFLAADPGLQSGLILAHVTAAALVSENKGLAHPASVDTIPTSAAQEDHVSMATWAARKAVMILDNTERVIAIEILAACQALDFLLPLRPAGALQKGKELLRTHIPRLEKDRVLGPDIEAVRRLIHSGSLRQQVEAVSGRLRE